MPTTIRVYIDGGGTPAATGTMAADRTFSVPVSGVANGIHTLEVTAQEDGKGESARVIQTVEVSRGQIQHALAGDLSALASAAADLTAPGAPSQQALAGDVAGAATATGDLTAPINLWGGATGTGTSAADLTAPGAGGASVSDDFNRASLGANWTALPGYSLPTIVSNAAKSGGAYYSGRAGGFADNQYAEIRVPVWSSVSSDHAAAVVRASSSAATRYMARFSFDDVEWLAWVYLDRVVSGATVNIGSFQLDPQDPFLRLEAQGTTVRALTKASAGASWTQRISVTDSGIASGYPGIYVAGGVSVDDFAAGDL